MADGCQLESTHPAVRIVIERFEALVSPEPMSGCWLWAGAPGDGKPNGQYGRFRMNGKQWRAHRAAWILFRGSIPSEKHVLHRCDNPACVNPEHLFIGSNVDNVADRVTKGRSGWKERKGESHPMRKLSEDDVRSIRLRSLSGESGRALALEFGIHYATVSEIKNRRKWKHIT